MRTSRLAVVEMDWSKCTEKVESDDAHIYSMSQVRPPSCNLTWCPRSFNKTTIHVFEFGVNVIDQPRKITPTHVCI